MIRTCKYTKRTTLEVVVIFPSCFCFLRLPDPIHPIPSTGIRAAFSFKWEARQRSQPTSKHLLNLLSPPPYHQEFHSEILRSRRRQRISEDPKESRSVSISKPQRSASNRVPDWNQSNRNSAYWNNPDLIPRHATQ